MKTVYEFRFPDIGEGIHEGRVLEWKHRPGDPVSEGQTLAVVETDKVVAEIPSPKDGVVLDLAVQEGQEIQVGQVLARLELDGPAEREAEAGDSVAAGHSGDAGGAGEAGEAAAAVVGRLEAGDPRVLPPSREASSTKPASWSRPSSGHPSSGHPSSGQGKAGRVPATPAARQLAARLGVDPTALSGTGPAGRVLKEDVLRASAGREAPAGDEAPADGPGGNAADAAVLVAGPRDRPGLRSLSTLRKTLARNLERSWRIPAAVVHELAVVDELVALRRTLNREAEGPKRRHLSYLPFFIKIAALGLRRYPLLNSSYHPEHEAFATPEAVNVGFALDSEEGLIVPVVHRADTLSLGEVQEQIERRRDEAARRALSLGALRDGTFTVSNYGSIGGLYGRPLILPPQVAILGIGRIHEAPAVRDGAVVAAHQLPLSLVFDHRLIDGAYAAGFLRFFVSIVSVPQRLVALLR